MLQNNVIIVTHPHGEYGKIINNEQTSSLNATVLLLWLAAAAIAPYESGGILCSDRGQSCDAFQAILLEETSPRCNKNVYFGYSHYKVQPKGAYLKKTVLYHNNKAEKKNYFFVFCVLIYK